MIRAYPLLLLLGGAVFGACSSDSDVIPSCLPPGYRPRATAEAARPPPEIQGEALDVKLAVVEGEVITRRRLTREVGGAAPGQDPAALERQIRQRLKQRARLLIFAREAQRAGITIRDQILDDVVAEQLEARRKEAEETIGEPVTVEAYLAEQGMTVDEFRQRVKEELQYQVYVAKLKEGVGGPTRPQVDMRAAPSEVRRIYWSHPDAFDERPAVRFALYQVPIDRYLGDDVGFLDAEEKAMADAERLAAHLAKGEDPEMLARRFEIEEGRWRVTGEDEYVEEGGQIRFLGEEPNAWLFDPSRKAGDTTVMPTADGPVVFGLIDRRPGRRVPYAEAYDKIVGLIEKVRGLRLVEQRLIEILSTRNVVQPDSLAAELLSDARRTLTELDRDPVTASAWFR